MVDDFIDAVNTTPELDLQVPETPAEWADVTAGFRAKSSEGLIDKCAGALDGYFQRTPMPTLKEAPNQIGYYSGHYESYGVNCQAVCRSDLRFIYFAVISPGQTNDHSSFNRAKGLQKLLEELPPGLYFVAGKRSEAATSIHGSPHHAF